MSLSRRSFTLSAMGAALAASLPAVPALARAPKAGAQVPGFYRFGVGDTEVTVLGDGYIPLESKLLSGVPDAPVALGANTVPTSVNGWLINDGERLILVDTGAGASMGDTLGKLAGNLKAAGYSPDQVDAVIITHLHLDHAAGLAQDGKAAFPKASVHVADAELAFWSDDQAMSRAPEGMKPYFELARGFVAPSKKTGTLQTFKEGELFPGIAAVAAPGHTPGHTMLRVRGGSEELLIWTDIVHNAALQFRQPERTIAFDTDPALAAETRKKVFDMVTADKLLVAGSHLPFPGVGHVAKAADGYRYVAEPWSPTL